MRNRTRRDRPSGTTSTWRHGEVTITIQFVNGKVVAKQFAKPQK